MRKYEIMYILKADLDEEARKAEIEKLHSIILNHGGEITRVDEMGLRDFAYPIDDMLKGFYMVLKVTADEPALNEFRRLTKIDRNVVRILIITDKEKATQIAQS